MQGLYRAGFRGLKDGEADFSGGTGPLAAVQRWLLPMHRSEQFVDYFAARNDRRRQCLNRSLCIAMDFDAERSRPEVSLFATDNDVPEMRVRQAG
jgi:hypothetical protein